MRWLRAAVEYVRARPVAFLHVLFFCLVAEYVVLGKYSFLQIHDFADDVFPRYIALWRNFAAFGVQAWSTDIGAGTDRIANLLRYTDLLPLLMSVLTSWLAYQVYILVTVYAGVVGFYRLNTIYFNHSRIVSALVAVLIPLVIAYVNSTGLSAGIQFYPFALYAVYWIDARFGSLWLRLALLIGLLYVTSLAMYFVLGFIYFVPFAVLWFVIVGRVKPGTIALLAVASLVVIGVHYADIVALTTLAPFSHRVEFASLQSNEGRAFFSPQVLLAIATLGFLILNRVRDVRILTVAALFLLITAGDGLLTAAWVQTLGRTALGTLKISRLGFFSTSLLAFAVLAVLARLTARQRPWFVAIVAVNVIVLFVAVKRVSLETWLRSGNYVANFEIKALKDLRASDTSLYRVAVLESALHPNMLSAYGFETADGYSPMYPLRYKHYWGQVLAPIIARDSPYLKTMFLDWGSRFYLWTGTPPSASTLARYTTIPFREWFDLDLLSLANVKYIVSPVPLIDDRLEAIATGVNAMSLEGMAKAKLKLRENFSGRESFFIYRNGAALDRVFAVDRVKYFDSEPQLLEYVHGATLEEMRSTAFALASSEARLAHHDLGHAAAAVTMTSYSPSKIGFATRSAGDALIVLSISMDAGWTCTSGGQTLEIFDVDGAFSAVLVGPGEQAVTCQYRPAWGWGS